MPATIVQSNPMPFAEVAIDPVTLDIIENALRNARVEMDTTLVRTAMSPGIREQGDAFPLIADTSMFGHQSDIGGKVAGSMPIDATSIFQEGVRFPPVKIWKQGVYNEDLIALVMHQTRTPEWCKADLNALIAACRVAARRVVEMAARFGDDVFVSAWLCCTTPDGIDADFISDYYAMRTVLGVPIWENRLRIAARTLRSVI